MPTEPVLRPPESREANGEDRLFFIAVSALAAVMVVLCLLALGMLIMLPALLT